MDLPLDRLSCSLCALCLAGLAPSFLLQGCLTWLRFCSCRVKGRFALCARLGNLLASCFRSAWLGFAFALPTDRSLRPLCPLCLAGLTPGFLLQDCLTWIRRTVLPVPWPALPQPCVHCTLLGRFLASCFRAAWLGLAAFCACLGSALGLVPCQVVTFSAYYVSCWAPSRLFAPGLPGWDLLFSVPAWDLRLDLPLDRLPRSLRTLYLAGLTLGFLLQVCLAGLCSSLCLARFYPAFLSLACSACALSCRAPTLCTVASCFRAV